MTIPFRLPTPIRVVVFGMLALLAQTYLWSLDVPLVLKALVVTIAIAAAVRPSAAMLACAAIVPFGRVISSEIYHVPPFARFNEAFALAFLAGWTVSRFRRGEHDRGLWPGSTSALLFGATLVASVLVELGVLRYWKDYWWPYVDRLAVFFARDYLTLAIDGRPWVGGVNGLLAPQAAALFLIGLALMWVVHVSCARDAALGRRVVYVSLAAAIGAAAAGLGLVSTVWAASGVDLLAFISDQRLSFHTTKVNVAASHYVLFIPIAAALLWSLFSRGRGRDRGAGILVGRLAIAVVALGIVILLAALWMTGSRSGLMALIGVLAAAMVVMAAARLRTLDRQRGGGLVFRPGAEAAVGGLGAGRGAGWAAAAGIVIMALLVYGLYERSGSGSRTWPIRLTLESRLTMWKYAADMVAGHPVFGVGIGQFRSASVAYLSSDPALRTHWGIAGFPAHNHVVQMAAELGLVGGLLFAAMFAGILWRAWIAFRSGHDALMGGVIAGLVAFLITCMAGNPLAVEVVAYPFWMMLGVALAAGASEDARSGGGQGFRLDSDDRRSAVASAKADRPGAQWHRRLIIAFLIILAASVPVRIWQGADGVNFALVDYGLADGWSNTGTDRDFKLVRGEATFFVYGRTWWLDVPVRRDVEVGEPGRDPQTARRPVEVEILLDGRIARRLNLADDQWQTAGFIIPPDANRPYRRIDVRVIASGGAPAVARLGRHDAKRR